MMEKSMGELPTALTATEAIAVAPESIDDQQTVATVQKTLLEKGYVDVGEIDGQLGKITKDEILAFRAHNDLPLVPVIDTEFIDKLAEAPSKEVSIRQATASVQHVAERVHAVAVTEQVNRMSWWSKFTAWIFGVGPVILSIVTAIIDNFDEAIAAVAPVRTMFSDLPLILYFLAFSVIAVIFGYQAYRISKLSKLAESALVEGYRVGTVKNDAPTNGKANGA